MLRTPVYCLSLNTRSLSRQQQQVARHLWWRKQWVVFVISNRCAHFFFFFEISFIEKFLSIANTIVKKKNPKQNKNNNPLKVRWSALDWSGLCLGMALCLTVLTDNLNRFKVQLSFWRLKRIPANTHNGLCFGKCIRKNSRQKDQKNVFKRHRRNALWRY